MVAPTTFDNKSTTFPIAMDARAAVETGDPLFVARLANMTLQVTGTFSATIDAQGSMDGVNWEDVATSLAVGFVEISERVQWLRLDTTGYVSGTPVVVLDGDYGEML